MWTVPLFDLNYDDREMQAVQEVIASRWLTMGEKTREFEKRFAEFLGNGSACLAVSCGTAALHLALLAASVGPGDEVLVPALTFVADSNVVRMVGAKPVFVDSTSADDFNISPGAVKAALTPRTRAVIVVHYGGYSCDMGPIRAAIQESGLSRKIYLIEDTAHGPGGDYKGTPCGTIGDVGCFSFFSNKNLSVGEGGMLVTASKTLLRKAGHLRSHGMSSLTLDRHQGRALSYDVVRPGLNYRMDELRAALGLVQLDKLPRANRQRFEKVKRYRERLAGTSGLQIPFSSWDLGSPTHHIFPVLLDRGIDRPNLMQGLKEAGIQSSIHYPVPQDFSGFQDQQAAETPIARDLSQRELTLPLFPTMTLKQVDLVCDRLQSLLAVASK
ncbi:MAG: DegT/DnrJ/EryC1/StrS family aminotransferase [Desulfohalobiaceae bacterium]|nr:DegT/DnrJ/EryC1/StrS family aminotransferase [Desulfohalobiaceae bacterium]